MTETIDVVEKKKKLQLRRSGTEKIRALYRAYLQETAARGIRISENMTSGEIYESAASVTDDAVSAEKMRQLYLSARYDDNAKLTEEDAKLAGETARRIYTRR